MPLPRVEAGEYLLNAFFEVGPTMQGGMGEAPLHWQEVDAYARQTQAISEPWEARALVQMSRAYLDGQVVGTQPLGKMPVEPE